MIAFLRKLGWLFRRRDKEADLRAELEFHLAEEAEERQTTGLADDAARHAARRDLGNLTLVQENTRSTWTWTFWEQLGQDLRYALRTMLRNRTFTALAALSLALGIGANTAIYSFMDSILLRALPVSDPASLVMLNWNSPGRNSVMKAMSGSTWGDSKSVTSGIFPYPAFELFQKNDALFSTVFAHRRARNLSVTIQGQGHIANGAYVSGDYFRGLEVVPSAGRLIFRDDDSIGAQPVVVVSQAFSERHFGRAVNATTQSILINSVPFTIIGVTPPGFFGVDPSAAPELYIPMHANLALETGQFGAKAEHYLAKNYYWIEVMGRLRPGVSLTQAQAALAPQFHQWVESTAATDADRVRLPTLVVREGAGGLDTLRRRYSKPLYVLMTMVGLILAIACANVANLLLARAAARRREIALRLSVGAGRLRLIRQLLTESVLLASLGGALGIGFALWGMRFLTFLLANGDANFTLHAEMNWRVLGVAAAISLLTGVLFGLAPALQSTRVDVIPALKEAQTGQAAGRRSLFRVNLSQALVTVQIALSLLMLIAAGLFVRTLANLQSVELGFNRENVLLLSINAREAGHKGADLLAFYGDLLKRLREIPGVRDAGFSDSSLIGAGFGLDIKVPGITNHPDTRIMSVGPGFFQTMQIAFLTGRAPDERDRPGTPAVAVINEMFAKHYFPDQNPLGRHLVLGTAPNTRDMEVVGVTRNARYGRLTDDFRPILFFTYDQGYPEPRQMVYALRVNGDPLVHASAVREILRQADPRVAISNIRTQAALIDQSINQEIVFARLCTGFAILALVIACVGLYGTVSYNVSRRTGEIGIRMALGARRGIVVRMILRQVVILAAVGLAIGLPAALALSKLVATFLFATKPNDPVTITVGVAILLSAALLAGYAPARRASHIDPLVALRHD
ncbi:MAG TPA: ABC transporter permease [Bryobacteraceae bacterium]|jgi:predicted permease|nr:ABC transporter permease [Bryobacteraceae bacterium]